MSENIEFKSFPKMARLSREMIVTEKIDGTNASVYIYDPKTEENPAIEDFSFITGVDDNDKPWCVKAGSRTRWINPTNDNFGFAEWVWGHAQELIKLGPGHHFGEWWGSGIQRNYGFKNGERFFSLFNTQRWCLHDEEPKHIQTADPRIVKAQERLPECCGLVPVIYSGKFNTNAIEAALEVLEIAGSKAAPGFMKPEGVVAYHVAGNVAFKKTLENDEEPKGKFNQSPS
jgi:hypothetical protein